MISKICLLFFISCFISIKSIDIGLTLGVELLSENHPLIITLKEPLINKLNPLDLFVVFDKSSSMEGQNLNILKSALNLIIDALDSNDLLNLIQYIKNFI